jgi:hydrogenase maturation protease
MNQKLVDTVVHAVLYEGYILYPYRASAKKNRQRFTFGRVYPEAYSVAENGAEPCLMQTQCLVKGPSSATVEVTVRFLHPMARDIGALAAPLRELPAPDNPDFFHVVPELEIEGHLYQSWQEAVERTVRLPAQTLSALHEPAERKIPFSFSASRMIEPILNRQKQIAGVIVRRQEAVEGAVELTAEPVDTSAFKITVRILNRTPVPPAFLSDPNEIVMRTFASTHTVLHAQDGEFLSSIDPPAAYAQAAAACRNIGTWPILVGEEEKKERDTMVSSPIILYDYPKIAPESPGDLFDSGEIDEILTLRIMTMTDEEKREMRGVDEQARRILERTEALPAGDLLKMHGVMCGTSTLDDEAFFNPATRLQTVSINGISLKKGDLVRVRPKTRADIMDIALAGKIAMIESIEQDAENKTHLALVLEDDPGKDMGMLRQSGHRFFYGTDEVEPLEGE